MANKGRMNENEQPEVEIQGEKWQTISKALKLSESITFKDFIALD